MNRPARVFLSVARCEIVRTISLGRDEPLHPEAPRERRNARAELRLTKRERRRWKQEAKALDVTFSDYVRAKIDDTPLRIIKLADPELLAELRRHGNNFNQCVHGGNAGWNVDRDRMNRAFDMLTKVYELLTVEFV